MITRSIIAFIVVVVLSGCGGEYFPKHALMDPANGLSIPHPVEVERNGVKKVTLFSALLDAGLLTESVANSGVWPSMGMKGDCKNLLNGYTYIADLGNYGDFVLNQVYNYSAMELAQVKFLYFNRDAGWAYMLSGAPVPEQDYNPEKFEKDEKYCRELFEKYGMTLEQNDKFWREYVVVNECTFLDGNKKDAQLSFDKKCAEKVARKLEGASMTVEFIVGSPEWEDYKKYVSGIMSHNHKMADGEIRMSNIDNETFRRDASKNNGSSWGKRFLKNSTIPIAMIVGFTGGPAGYLAASNIAGDALAAGIDTKLKGYSDRATIETKEMKPNFRTAISGLKYRIKERDSVIREQNIKIAEYEEILKKHGLQNKER